MLKNIDGQWFVYSEDGKKRLSRGYNVEKYARQWEVERNESKANVGVVHNASAVAEEPGVTTNTLQSITSNIKSAIRHEAMEDRDYLVVPVVMMVEGVLNGSNGPLYYPKDELAKLPSVWNHKPIVVYHPTMNGVGISACDPQVISKQKVGVIMNTRFDGKRLTAEAWLEPSRLKKVDERILENIESGKMTEVSTGLFTDNEDTSGKFKGVEYKAIARNYRPDHLAILPDQKGACSIADGAGLLRNQSFDEIRKQLGDQLQAKQAKMDKATASPSSYPYVRDVYETRFVYEKDGKLYAQEYTAGEEDVQLTGLPVEVKEVKEYRTEKGEVISNGGEGSGNFGHASRPGERGGSAGAGGPSATPILPKSTSTTPILPKGEGPTNLHTKFKASMRALDDQITSARKSAAVGDKIARSDMKQLRAFRDHVKSGDYRMVMKVANGMDASLRKTLPSKLYEAVAKAAKSRKPTENSSGLITNRIVEEDGMFYVCAKDSDKKLSKGYTTKEEAMKRMAQIEMFKHMNANGGEGSGNFGHAGRPGERGGSGGGGSSSLQDRLDKVNAGSEAMSKVRETRQAYAEAKKAFTTAIDKKIELEMAGKDTSDINQQIKELRAKKDEAFSSQLAAESSMLDAERLTQKTLGEVKGKSERSTKSISDEQLKKKFSYSKSGGYAGEKALASREEKLKAAGFKLVDVKSGSSASGGAIGHGRIYQDDQGRTFSVSASYGGTARDNRFSITYLGTKPTGNSKWIPTLNKERTMNKEQMIAALIANGTFEEEDADFLSSKSDEQIAKLHQNAFPPKKDEEEMDEEGEEEMPPKGKKPVKNEETEIASQEVMTVDEFIANAPAEMQDVLRSGVRAHNAQKENLIKVITANKANTFTKEVLINKSLDELQALAQLAAASLPKAEKPVSFAGLGEVTANADTGTKEEPLVAPTMNFGEEKK